MRIWGRARVGQVAAVVVAGAIGVAAAGCGSDDETSTAADRASGTTSTASSASNPSTAEITKLQQRPTDIGVTEPIEGGVPAGKSIAYLQCAFPDCVQIGDAMDKAAAKVGWKVDHIPIGTSPETINSAWQEALRRNPDGIVLTGAFSQSFYQESLDKARERKIPVVAFSESTDGDPFTLVVGSGQGFASITSDIAAKFVASEIDGGDVVAVDIPGIAVVEDEISNFAKQLPKYCPDCKVNKLDIPPASLGKDATAKIASYLQANPDTKFMFLGTIDLALGLDSALASAGVEGVPAIGQTTSADGLDAIRKGEAGLVATTTYPSGEGAYRSIDALARVFQGQSVDPDRDATLPQWLVTKDNLPDEWPLPAVKDYAEQFHKLWGVQ